jgi:hypothetical protein
MRGNKVERFKLTREQLAFQKAYKKVNSIAKMLQQEMAATAERGASLSEMMQEVSGQLTQLIQAAPRKPVHELSGQSQQSVTDSNGLTVP